MEKEINLGIGFVTGRANVCRVINSYYNDVLRQMDKMNIDIVYSEEFPRDGVGQAIMNRLLKSAGYKTIKA